MITTAAIRNGFWCAIAFVIVACASAPTPVEGQEGYSAQGADEFNREMPQRRAVATAFPAHTGSP